MQEVATLERRLWRNPAAAAFFLLTASLNLGCAKDVAALGRKHHFSTYAENEFFGPYVVRFRPTREIPLDDSELREVMPALKKIAPYSLDFGGSPITDESVASILGLRSLQSPGWRALTYRLMESRRL